MGSFVLQLLFLLLGTLLSVSLADQQQRFPISAVHGSAFVPTACGQCPPPYPAPCLQFYGPEAPSEWSSWFANVSSWRNETIRRLNLSTAAYHLNALQWVQTSVVLTQIHPFDRFFYNKTSGEYTVDFFLDDLLTRYGGSDGFLVWPTYPNIGVDDRNQFDWHRSLPQGGLAALARVVAALHARGKHVQFPYNPWDVGTRREPVEDPEAVAALLVATGADGFNGDTMVDIPVTFWNAAVRAGLPGVAIQPEIGGLPADMNWVVMGWAEGWNYPPGQPCVDADRFIMRRRMSTICDRWAKDKTQDIQAAFVNGAGYNAWENVWGTWNGITRRGGELIRRFATILRYLQPFYRMDGESWQPLVPCEPYDACFASSWSAPAPTRNATEVVTRIWFAVNRGNASVEANITLTAHPLEPEELLFDCYRGNSVEPLRGGWTLPFPLLSPLGLGCLAAVNRSRLHGDGALEWQQFLNEMNNMSSVPLSDIDNTWTFLTQEMVPSTPFTAAGLQHGRERENLRAPLVSRPRLFFQVGGPSLDNTSATVIIPASETYRYETTGIEIEGPPGYGVDVQFPWEAHPSRHHGSVVSVASLEVDVFLVTNAMWLSYLQQSGYQPADPTNYLRFWTSNGTFPAGAENQPVSWVSYDEAALYCEYYGWRLPAPWEWLYFAQGGNSTYAFPWGNGPTPQDAIPNATTGNQMPLPPTVDCCSAQGASAFGVRALFGYLWQWTSTFVDAHTRAALIVGGSYYRPSGSGWYLRQPGNLTEHNKLLLMDDSYDRSGGVGFRCVRNVQ